MIYSKTNDPSIVIGDNGHVYAATRLPECGWQFRESWAILDQLKPGVIPANVRLYLAGLIAGRLDTMQKALGGNVRELEE